MRKVLICLAAAATAASFATPASAHWARYDNTAVRIYVARVVELQARINRLDNQDVLSRHDARRLRGEAAGLRALVGIKANNGLNTAERIEIDLRIARIEREIRRESRDRNRWRDADRRRGDGRDDRYHILPVDQNGRRGDGRDDRYHTLPVDQNGAGNPVAYEKRDDGND
jgi:hypothetical protein